MFELQLITTASYFSYVSLLVLFQSYVRADKRQDVESHMERGKMFLAKGQFSEALQHYHAAAELDPTDYQIFYRRATVLLATGKMKAALPDLDKVVELKPDFIAGRVQRGNILLKHGQLDDAIEDFKFALKHDKNHNEAKENINKIRMLKELVEQSSEYFENDDYQSAETLLDKAIEHCQWDAELHRKRSKCRLARGDVHNAISDLRALAKIIPDSTEDYLEISKMYYKIGDVENSLSNIRECLKLNPDHKECFPYYKRVKKLAKLREGLQKTVDDKKWTECIKKGVEILKFEKNIKNVELDVLSLTCKCNLKLQHAEEAIQECTEVLTNRDENDLDLLLDRGEAYILLEDFDKAVEDFQKALNAHEDSRKAKESLNRAQKLLKMSKKKDYYKILGVKRTDGKKDILKAYRKLAQKWHPDNFRDEKEKAKAQEKFFDIANAKDVLTDPEKRAKYDAGEDPLDPQSGGAQQQWHQHFGGDSPFGHGFPFGSGGHTFKFNFG